METVAGLCTWLLTVSNGQKSRIYFAIHAALPLFSGPMRFITDLNIRFTPVTTTGTTTITG
jgi:hypothetical protein